MTATKPRAFSFSPRLRALPSALLLALAACSDPAPPAATTTNGATVNSNSAAANSAAAPQVPAASATSPAAPAQDTLGSGVELANFDQSVAPGADFYRHVDGTWLASTQIPADKSNYGAFTQLDDTAQEQLRTIIESAAVADAARGSDTQKVGDFFKSFMNETAIEKLGATPLNAGLAEIAATPGKPELLRLSAELNRIGVDIPAAIYINNDEMQSDQYITYLTQSGLGLPDRDWYLSTDNPSHAQARAAYAAYIDKILALAGYRGTAPPSAAVLRIERRLAEAQWDRVRNRQAELTYNKRTLNELQAMAPMLDWAALLQGLGVNQTTLVVNQPSFIEAYGTIWNEESLADWQTYFSF
ncbi:MAG: M13 family metallopeptidase, partial [Pseudomonadales bacterium]|nr:M13 family metallopeptidase [Pseudomonadales bacterium]